MVNPGVKRSALAFRFGIGVIALRPVRLRVEVVFAGGGGRAAHPGGGVQRRGGGGVMIITSLHPPGDGVMPGTHAPHRLLHAVMQAGRLAVWQADVKINDTPQYLYSIIFLSSG